MEKMLFCRVAWMKRYQGRTEDDPPKGGGKGGPKGEKYEVCNFSPDDDGCLYGYVQPGGETIAINRIGRLDPNDESRIKEVTVIWVATHPEERGKRIVGWYKDATVFRDPQEFAEPLQCQTQQKPTKVDKYWIKAHKDNSKLLPENDRGLEIPRGEGWMGHDLIWYADDRNFKESQSEFKKRVSKYIREYELSSAINQRWGGTAEQRKEVEEAAINRCIAHYEELGYNKVTNVGKLNKGWDLEATEPDKKYLNESLNIEVKGLSRSNPSIVLTPNEYEAFKERKSNYRLAVVVNALKRDEQELFICRYSKEQGEQGDWLVERIGSKKNLTLSAEDKIFGSIKIEIEPNKQE